MVRFSFGLPEKNPFNVKKNQMDAKRKLDLLDELVSDRKVKLNVLKETISTKREVSDIESDISKIQEESDRVSSPNSGYEDSVTAIGQLIDTRKRRIREILNELNLVKNRRSGLANIKADIETEVNTLSLNEEARRVFMSFGEICPKNDCQLFSKSSDLYAKNLLYLKDQIKDLESNDEKDRVTEIELSSELEALDKIISDLNKERDLLVEKSDDGSLKIRVELELELYRLQSELIDAGKVDIEDKNYVTLLNRRDDALNSYEAYRAGGKVDLRLSEFKKILRLSFVKWLAELKTSNISHDITFKNDFEPMLGVESVNQLSGSTGSRAVLAFHAALFEMAVKNSPFNFLILDAPKQHETENLDLDKYMTSLKNICKEFGVQVIFSATEYEYKGDEDDKAWLPLYDLGNKKMFMRSTAR